MKFLVITKPRTVPLPDNYVELVKAAKEWLNAKVADGTIDFVYSMLPNGGVSITNVDSHKQAFDLMQEYPLTPFLDWKIVPLVDLNYTFDKLIKALSR